MIKEKALLGRKYKFQHIKLEVLEKDDQGNVVAFASSFVTTRLPGRTMSDGHMEINRTLWDQNSPKRPPGYWLIGHKEADGVMKSFFVAEEWMGRPQEQRLAQEAAWGVA